jgi:hypothetical protein
MTEKNESLCPRGERGLLSRCSFEPRYDIGPSSIAERMESMKFSGIGAGRRMKAIIEASSPKTYVRDICVTCGKVVERQPTT